MLKQINKDLKNNKNEDLDLIKKIESIFKNKRDVVFKQPKKNESVILLLSGGLDSIAAWHFLMDKYKLNVYPLVLGKKQFFSKNHQSITHYKKKFKEKFPKLFNDPFYSTDPRIGQKNITNKFFSKKKFMENKDDFIFDYISKNLIGTEIFGQTSSFMFSAKTYADFLKAKHNINIKTIFTATLSTDGEIVKHQTLTSLRLTNLLICFLSKDWNIQISSILAEPEMNNWFNKTELIKKFQKEEKLELEKTWSCYEKKLFHCGKCFSCLQRKKSFQEQELNDQTIYIDEIYTKVNKIYLKIKGKIKHETKKILHTK